MDKYELSKSEFFRFQQIRHFIQKNTTLKDHFKISPVERLLFQTTERTSISLFYYSVCSVNGTDSQNIRKKWEKEQSIPIDEDVWECANKISVCNRARAIQLNILHRLHISPNRRHTFNSSFLHLHLCM